MVNARTMFPPSQFSFRAYKSASLPLWKAFRWYYTTYVRFMPYTISPGGVAPRFTRDRQHRAGIFLYLDESLDLFERTQKDRALALWDFLVLLSSAAMRKYKDCLPSPHTRKTDVTPLEETDHPYTYFSHGFVRFCHAQTIPSVGSWRLFWHRR
jgi:hypothetical protein